jgi:hypothetical protein
MRMRPYQSQALRLNSDNSATPAGDHRRRGRALTRVVQQLEVGTLQAATNGLILVGKQVTVGRSSETLKLRRTLGSG